MGAIPLVLLLVISCADSGAEGTIRWDGSVEQVGSGVVIRNPDKPLLGFDAVSAELVWEAPQVSAAGVQNWEGPSRLVTVERGIYVLDEMAKRIYAISPGGEWTRTFGREGGGPGEFIRPFGIAADQGRLIIGDGGKGTLEVLREDGAYERSVPLGAVGFSLARIEPGKFLVNALTGSAPVWRTYEIGGVHKPWNLPEAPLAGAGDNVTCTQVATGGGHVLQLNCTVPAFQIIDANGTVLREVRIDRAPENADPEALRRFEQTVAEQMSSVGYRPDRMKQMVAETLDRFRVKRSMRRVQFDEVGGLFAIWQQDPDELGGGHATLHLLSEEGVYLAAVDFPSPWVDFAFRDNRVYALVRDLETDLVHLSAYDLRVPDSAKSLARSVAGPAD
jgi:hypothetical protein